jgi:hypothetical protein
MGVRINKTNDRAIFAQKNTPAQALWQKADDL